MNTKKTSRHFIRHLQAVRHFGALGALGALQIAYL